MTARKPATKTRARSKTETKEAFENLRESVENTEGSDRVSAELAKGEKSRVTAAVGAITVESVVKKTTDLELQLARALGNVREQLVGETQQLDDLRAAIGFAKEELQQLHNIDLATTALENLIEEYKEKDKELLVEIANKRAAWTLEQQGFDKAVNDRDAELLKARKREVADYEYNLDLNRKKEKDAYDQRKMLLERDLTEAKAIFDKATAERTAVLDAREKEYNDHKTQVTNFPEVLRTEVGKAVAIATSALKKDMTNDHALLAKDTEAKIKLLEAQLAQAETDKTRMATEISSLAGKLEAAQLKVVEVANKAVEGASGQLAMQKVQETIATTANGGSRKQ